MLAPESDVDQVSQNALGLLNICQVLTWPVNGAELADFSKLEKSLVEFDENQVVVNLSGGTRLQALELLAWANRQGYDSYLIDQYDRLHWVDKPSVASQQVPDKANLKNYFQIRNITILRMGMDFNITPSLREIVKRWVLSNHDRSIFRQLNWQSSNAKIKDDGRFKSYLDECWETSPISGVLADLQQEQLLSCRDREITYVSESARFFCNGGWMELFVYDQIQSIKSSVPEIQDVWIAAEVVYPEKVKNELDVVFLANNQLHLIEVKTSYLKNNISSANNIIYKLDALSGALGQGVKGMVVSLFPLPHGSLGRAGLHEIEVLAGDDLHHIKSRIKQWIYSTHGIGEELYEAISKG